VTDDFSKLELRVLAHGNQPSLREQAMAEIRGACSPAERAALKIKWHPILYGTGRSTGRSTLQTPEWNYSADYRRHGGYDGWGTHE